MGRFVMDAEEIPPDVHMQHVHWTWEEVQERMTPEQIQALCDSITEAAQQP